jgi:predicted ATP-binding protein involved in virulence
MALNDLLRVTKIRVEGLFDRYSHEVDLHLDERITIIHGPNGVGKTVLLRLTDALLSGKLTDFAKIPFKKFEVSLSDGSTIGASQAAESQASKTGLPSTFFLKSASGAEESFEVKVDYAEVVTLAARIESDVSWLARLSKDQYLDRRSGETLSALELVSKYPEFLPNPWRKQGVFTTPEWLQNIRKRVEIHLVAAQRLLRFSALRDEDFRSGAYYHPGYQQTQYVDTVKDYAKDLHKRISDALQGYAREAQSLDQSFPERLLTASDWSSSPVQGLKDRMQKLERKREQLKRIGLVAEDRTYPFNIAALETVTDAQRSVMTLYVDDTERKLGVFDDLAQRIEIMLDIINKKFQHKTIQISRDRGLAAVTPEGKQLELDALSSGEQHELVLLYDLLFRVKANTLVLIDEPELSLHVTWQKSFLPDLLEIVNAAKLDVLLATHSPFIVGDRSDLMIELRAGGN